MTKLITADALPKVGYCISETLRDEQIKINLKKVSARFTPQPQGRIQKEPVAIVCFGPSLKKTWKDIKKFKHIITCSGAHKFLIEKGIIPTYHVDLDPREHKIKLLGTPNPKVKYMLASTIHPNYIDFLREHNAKKIQLWHIFAHEWETKPVLPRGETLITGGSSVGLRCLNLALLMGYRDFHIFGLDGNFEDNKSHAGDHPNAPKDSITLEFDGVKYQTTGAMAVPAFETPKELDQMPGVKYTFYGEGLTQHIMRKHKSNPVFNVPQSLEKPELISEEYIRMNKKLHEKHPSYGMGGERHAKIVQDLYKGIITPEKPFAKVLDYGCGKGTLSRALPFAISEYDPAIPGKSDSPEPHDFVVCTDVLEHIEPEKLNFVLEDLKRLTKQIGYFVISTREAVKNFDNGKNAHLIVQDKNWWKDKISKYFSISKQVDVDARSEVHFFVMKKTAENEKPGTSYTVTWKGNKINFRAVNDTAAWRIKTLFSKEPVTIHWLRNMQKGETMIDIGANMGSYSLLAATRGVKVTAFEPEAENYALLQTNILLNPELDVTAYCAAIGNTMGFAELALGQRGPAGSMHNLNGVSKVKQGTIAFRLDDLQVPPVDYVKIDVDGIEPEIIAGGLKFLRGCKSMLIEVNTRDPKHIEMVKVLDEMGFTFDEAQRDKSIRPPGHTFEGTAEIVFYKKGDESPVKSFLVADAPASVPPTETPKPGAKAPVKLTLVPDAKAKADPATGKKKKETAKERKERQGAFNLLDLGEPFDIKGLNNVLYGDTVELSHFNQIFAKNIYSLLIPELEELEYDSLENARGTKGYPQRFVANLESNFIWNALKAKILDGRFKNAICQTFAIDPNSVSEDLLMIKDLPGYKIGPHCDTDRKVITGLIYCAPLSVKNKKDQQKAGTVLYTPKDAAKKIEFGRHYDLKEFDQYDIIPYAPNTAVFFRNTKAALHGVEKSDITRFVLLYNLNRKS